MTEIKRSHGSNTDNLKQTQHTSNNPYVIQDGIRENNEYSVIGRRNSLLNRINGHSNSGSSSSAGGGRDINYCEIYFLSPSKRRISSDNIHQQQFISGTPPPSLSSSATMATTIATNNHYHMKWPTVATQATILRDKMNSQSQTDAFFENSNNIFAFNTRQSYDATLDNLEIRSHYSDSAATTIPVIQQMASATRSRNNNVTFSNCLTPPLLHASTTTTTGTAINTGDERMIHSNRGSLRRSKGRSIQSLCSCDAADSEIIPNPNRPLYQYNLDRKNKIHTYTCEQNAQILMRLEREKRKLSSRINFDKQGNETHDMINGSCEETPFDLSTVYHDNSNSLESESTTDVDIIPPPPPPIANKNRKITEKITTKQIYQHQKQQQHQYQQQKIKQQQYQQQQDSINDYNSSITTSSIKDTESMLNDCTSTILNCANVSHLTSGNNNNGGGGGNATKPDLCNINKIEKLHRSNSNNKSRSNQENISLAAPYPYIRDDTYIPCFKSKNEDSVYFYHEESPQYAPNFDNRPNSGKYNTIGPSSCYAKHLTPYYQQHNSCNLAHVNDKTSIATKTNKTTPETNLNHHSTTIGRYFSQSLLNFSLIGNGNGNGRNNDTNGNNDSGLPSRQLGQTIDDYHHWYHHNNHDLNNITTSSSSTTGTATATTKTSATTITPYTQFRTPANNNLNCNNYGESTLIDSSYTSINSSMSGLKTKLHRHSHQQHHQEQQNHQQQLNTPTGTSGMPWKHRQCPSRGSSSSGTNSFRFDPSRHWLAVSSILLIVGAASVAVPMALRVAASAPFEERLRAATQLLDEVPLIDGHNDLPWNIRKFLHNKLNDFNFDEDLRNIMPWARSHWSHTDLQRLKKGRVSAQFWAAYVPCEAQHRDAVQLTLEQIDVIKRLTERYSPQLTTCTSASDIIEAHKNHQLCSLTGVEGGHSLGGSLAVLRTLYAIGVRYMTLTSTCHTPWADSSYADAPTYNVKHGGLTVFGKTIIREMNRLGMIVDLSHVSTGTMRDALATSEAPVIFSHSSAYELCNSSRNVQDDILQSVAKNGGIVMVNFYSKFLSCSENSTVHDAVAHINHIKRIAGIDHVGLGAGFDGINFTPKGLEDVSTYPTLFAELLGEGWSIEDLTKLAGQNFLRVMQEVEKVRDAKKLAGVRPYEDHPNFRTEDPYNCTSS